MQVRKNVFGLNNYFIHSKTFFRDPPGPSSAIYSASSSSSNPSLHGGVGPAGIPAEKSSLGYEEYTDEPSVISWKRRRRSDEILRKTLM